MGRATPAALSFGIIGLRIDRWRSSPARIGVTLPAAGPVTEVMPAGPVLAGWAIATTWIMVAGPVLHLPAAFRPPSWRLP